MKLDSTVTRKAISQKYAEPDQIPRVNTVEEKDDDDSTDEKCTYQVTLHSMRDKISIPCVTKCSRRLTEITIGDKTVTCLIDSGTGVNVIDTSFFNQLKNMHIQPTS